MDSPRCRALLALAVALSLAPAADAVSCTIDARPAATLLLPHFEVDLADPDGIDTFFSINNATPQSLVAHVILWTDLSVEALDFNVYLTGYDTQTIGLGLVLRDGVLPSTAADASLSPVGPYSATDALSRPGCDALLPYQNPALDADFLAHLQSILTGGPSAIYAGRCGGLAYGDSIARGYVTVDVMRDCTLLTPCEPGYFFPSEPGGEPAADWVNALWGDFYLVDRTAGFAQGDALVHIESFDTYPGDPEVFQPSFWGRCALYYLSTYFPDFREPLPTTFAAAFFLNPLFDGGTELLIWRDSLFSAATGEERGFDCASGPSWYPLEETQVVAFDEEENPESECNLSPCPPPPPFAPAESQRIDVRERETAPACGWLYLNLNRRLPFFGDLVTVSAQAWVGKILSAEGRFSAGLPAIQLDSQCDGVSRTIGRQTEGYPQEEPTLPVVLWYILY